MVKSAKQKYNKSNNCIRSNDQVTLLKQPRFYSHAKYNELRGFT